ncbi:MAG: hypothetical protein M0Z95_03920 [Actinomycetota bacterium]|nr:hypothetical protein [Actinomycetota bacterium]
MARKRTEAPISPPTQDHETGDMSHPSVAITAVTTTSKALAKSSHRPGWGRAQKHVAGPGQVEDGLAGCEDHPEERRRLRLGNAEPKAVAGHPEHGAASHEQH